MSLYKQPSLFINKLIYISQFINKLASLQTDKNLQTDYNIYKQQYVVVRKLFISNCFEKICNLRKRNKISQMHYIFFIRLVFQNSMQLSQQHYIGFVKNILPLHDFANKCHTRCKPSGPPCPNQGFLNGCKVRYNKIIYFCRKGIDKNSLGLNFLIIHLHYGQSRAYLTANSFLKRDQCQP